MFIKQRFLRVKGALLGIFYILAVRIKNHNKMKALVQKINTAIEAFSQDATLNVEKANKAAGARARKISLEIEKLMKEYRKKSIEESKK